MPDHESNSVPREPRGPFGRWRWIRLSLFLLIVAGSIGVLFFSPLRDLLEPRRMYETIERIGHHRAAPFTFLAIFLGLALLGSPMVPPVIAGAALFGFERGLVLNYVGVLLGASSSYWLARLLGRDFFQHMLGSRFDRFESLLRQRGFWPMVQMRFLPIPFAVANYGPALLGVGYLLFLTSTALAFLPILTVYSHFAALVVRVGESERRAILQRLGLSILLLLLLTFLPTVIARLRSGHRRKAAPTTTDRATPR